MGLGQLHHERITVKPAHNRISSSLTFFRLIQIKTIAQYRSKSQLNSCCVCRLTYFQCVSFFLHISSFYFSFILLLVLSLSVTFASLLTKGSFSAKFQEVQYKTKLCKQNSKYPWRIFPFKLVSFLSVSVLNSFHLLEVTLHWSSQRTFLMVQINLCSVLDRFHCATFKFPLIVRFIIDLLVQERRERDLPFVMCVICKYLFYVKQIDLCLYQPYISILLKMSVA
jgi:hypothetical protein